MLTTMSDLPAGFADSVLSAQSTFRAVMEAMARPGSMQRVTAAAGVPAALMHATSALALTLLDHDTAIWLDPGLAAASGVAAWLRFHTGAPVVEDPASAAFALVADGASLPDLERFALGSNEYPDRSTTVILQVKSLTEGRTYQLQGPGIDGAASVRALIAPDDLFERLAINVRLFPRGVDVILVHDDSIVAIPRTTRLTAVGG
jgi:alpha-D-ribose 1-methylphosphonate 5-triphosphate synthase subunit PhnH